MNTLAKRLKVEKIVEIPCFQFFLEGGIVDRLDFIPVQTVPGFTHRVAYNGKLTGKYLGKDFTICQRNAIDMLDIIRNGSKE